MPNKPPKLPTPLQQHHRRKAILRELCQDFGGEPELSTIQRGLLRQAAILLLRVELAEISIARGEPHDEKRFASDVALALRVLSRLGARAANVKMTEPEETLASYIAKHDARKAAEKALGSEATINPVSDAPASELAPVAAPLPQQQEPLQ